MAKMHYQKLVNSLGIGSPSLHELEPFDSWWYLEVDSDGMVNAPKGEVNYFKEKTEGREPAYKLIRFGGPNGPIHRIALGAKE